KDRKEVPSPGLTATSGSTLPGGGGLRSPVRLLGYRPSHPAIDPFGSLSHRFLPLFVFVVVQPPDRLGRHRTGHLFGQPWESVDPLSHPVFEHFLFRGA